MNIRSSLEVEDLTGIEALDEGWVLTLPLNQPALSTGVRWTDRGPFSGFFHGILFNRDALANPADCEQQNCSDAELVLRAYEREGEAVLPRLRGSFVIAIMDRTRGRAVVARDPTGSRPLYYVKANSAVLFAGSSRTLLSQPGVSRTVNRAALADHICHRWPDPHETFFAAVRRLPPGWRAVISGGNMHLQRYWDPAPIDRPVPWLTADDASFDETLDRAIDRCVQNHSTGIYLSGGLDSISVAAFATDRARKTGRSPPLALSLAFPDPGCDERVRQAAIARDLGLRQHLVDFNEAVGPRPLFEQWIELSQQLTAPLLNIWQPAFLGLARRGRADGVRAILTGHGGDEWLTVSPYLSADLMRRGRVLEFLGLLRTFWRSYRIPPHMIAQYAFWSFGLRPLLGAALHWLIPEAHKANRLKRLLASDPSWIAPDQDLRTEQRQRAENAMPESDPPQGFYLRFMHASLDHTFTSWELEEQYELGKQIGIRFLHPFWDPDVVEMLYRMPPSLLNEGGRSKGLVRGSLARRFPTLGLERQRKVAATSFYRTLLVREGRSLVDEAGDFPALTMLGILNPKEAQSVLRQRFDKPGPMALLSQAWAVVNVEMWARAQLGR